MRSCVVRFAGCRPFILIAAPHTMLNGCAAIPVNGGVSPAAVQELFRSEGFGHTSVMRDLCGKECVVCARA